MQIPKRDKVAFPPEEERLESQSSGRALPALAAPPQLLALANASPTSGRALDGSPGPYAPNAGTLSPQPMPNLAGGTLPGLTATPPTPQLQHPALLHSFQVGPDGRYRLADLTATANRIVAGVPAVVGSGEEEPPEEHPEDLEDARQDTMGNASAEEHNEDAPEDEPAALASPPPAVRQLRGHHTRSRSPVQDR